MAIHYDEDIHGKPRAKSFHRYKQGVAGERPPVAKRPAGGWSVNTIAGFGTGEPPAARNIFSTPLAQRLIQLALKLAL